MRHPQRIVDSSLSLHTIQTGTHLHTTCRHKALNTHMQISAQFHGADTPQNCSMIDNKRETIQINFAGLLWVTTPKLACLLPIARL